MFCISLRSCETFCPTILQPINSARATKAQVLKPVRSSTRWVFKLYQMINWEPRVIFSVIFWSRSDFSRRAFVSVFFFWAKRFNSPLTLFTAANVRSSYRGFWCNWRYSVRISGSLDFCFGRISRTSLLLGNLGFSRFWYDPKYLEHLHGCNGQPLVSDCQTTISSSSIFLGTPEKLLLLCWVSELLSVSCQIIMSVRRRRDLRSMNWTVFCLLFFFWLKHKPGMARMWQFSLFRMKKLYEKNATFGLINWFLPLKLRQLNNWAHSAPERTLKAA